MWEERVVCKCTWDVARLGPGCGWDGGRQGRARGTQSLVHVLGWCRERAKAVGALCAFWFCKVAWTEAE